MLINPFLSSFVCERKDCFKCFNVLPSDPVEPCCVCSKPGWVYCRAALLVVCTNCWSHRRIRTRAKIEMLSHEDEQMTLERKPYDQADVEQEVWWSETDAVLDRLENEKCVFWGKKAQTTIISKLKILPECQTTTNVIWFHWHEDWRLCQWDQRRPKVKWRLLVRVCLVSTADSQTLIYGEIITFCRSKLSLLFSVYAGKRSS